ncbi:MAG: Ig-like domain-containing protein [bacterium]|nr:Ig-like domain-containing protein [bacterium]
MRARFVPLLATAAACALAACSHASSTNVKLAPVSALARPTLPPWIASISPTARAQSLAQIRVIFAKPVAPVSSLEGNGPRAVLDHLRIDPALPGHFVLLTPKMIGFVAERALPVGARVRVTLTRGLRDLDGDALGADLAWTFETAPLAFSDLPDASPSPDDPTPPPVALRPHLLVTANAAVDAGSLAAHATLDAGGAPVALDAALQPTPTPPPGTAPDATTAFDPSQRSWVYVLTPRTTLAQGTLYHLTIAPGVEPAVGNVASARAFSGSVRTYDRLAVVPTASPSGDEGARFAQGDPVIAFDNPIAPDSLAGNVTISPQPSPAPKIAANDAQIAIDPYALAPDRDYTVTIGTGVRDVFGQSLASPVTVQVHTGDFAPGAWIPQGSTLIAADAGVAVNFYATNLPGNRFRSAFASLTPEQVLGGSDAASVLPSPAATWPLVPLANAKTNVQSVERMRVQQRLGAPFGTLAYGVAAPLAADGTPSSDNTMLGSVTLTDLGVFAQFFPMHGEVLVQRMSDGAPVANAAVGIYRLPDAGGVQNCANGSTDAGGAFQLQGIDLESCYVGASPDAMPALGVIVRSGSDVATVRVEDYSGIYRYDVPFGWAGGAPRAAGTIFSDRSLYQPGERGVFTGIAYIVRNGEVVADRDASYRVSLVDPSGAERALGNVTTDAYGTFAYPYTFAKDQALGYYTLDARGPSGATIVGSFRVAEFKPPNFKLDLALDAASARPGARVGARATAAYLFGAPLEGGNAHVTITRDYASVSPKGWDAFAFGRAWLWPQQQPSLTTDVLQRDMRFDASGNVRFDVPIGSDLPAPLTYTVEATATDVSNLSVSNATTLLALPADGVIGLASDTVGAAGSAMPVRVIVTDADGTPLPGRAVHLELQKMTYVSSSQALDGGEAAQQSVRFDTVARADVTSAKTPVTATLTPTDAGSYRVRANFAGASSAASATDLQVFAFGAGEADLGTQDTASVPVTLNKKLYRVGDEATAVIGSPYAHADVYVSVVRHDVISRFVLHDVSGVPHVSFRITPAMFPNAALEAVVVRRGEPLAHVRPGSLDSIARVGLARFNLDLKDRELSLHVAPAHANLAPGARQSVTFTLRDAQGHPVRGKIIAMAVNDAILQLSGYRLPDLVTTVFADQPISTRFADNRENVTLQTQQAPVEKGFGYGGGFLAGAASTRVRTHFLPLAYYGSAISDARGEASVTFDLPDDLTTWRVMAVAIASDDRRFGTSDATFVTSLPLMANPLLPQFARPGDTFDAGASIFNQTGSAGTLDLAMQLEGALRFASGDAQHAQMRVQAPTGISAQRASVVAGTPAPAWFGVRAALGGANDAFRVPFEIRDRATTESVFASADTARATDLPVAFDRPGTVRITLANSVVPQFAVPVERMLRDDALPYASESAARLTVASALLALAPRYGEAVGSAADAKTQVAAALTALAALQRSDGGFGFVPNARASDPFASGYALDALGFARAHGVEVSSTMLARASAYATQTLANPGRYHWCARALCKAQVRLAMLEALAASGARTTAFVPEVLAQADAFDAASRLRLARLLLATPGYEARGSALAATLQQTLYASGRYAVANQNDPWAWRDDVVTAQAQMLQLLLARHAPPDLVAGAVRALVAQPCRCGWPTLPSAAAAMRALVAYTATERIVPTTAIVSADGRTLASAHFGARASEQSVTFASADVHGGALHMSASGGGTVHALVLYTYPVSANAPGALAALRVTRSVRDVGASDPLATMDLAPLAGDVALGVGRVYDVGVRIVVDHVVSRLEIEDPLPAGLEAVDSDFVTAPQSLVPQSDAWELEDRTIYRDRVTAFAALLTPGIYEMHYLVRSVTPGTYRWPGARAYLLDAPEAFGRSAAATLVVK